MPSLKVFRIFIVILKNYVILGSAEEEEARKICVSSSSRASGMPREPSRRGDILSEAFRAPSFLMLTYSTHVASGPPPTLLRDGPWRDGHILTLRTLYGSSRINEL